MKSKFRMSGTKPEGAVCVYVGRGEQDSTFFEKYPQKMGNFKQDTINSSGRKPCKY